MFYRFEEALSFIQILVVFYYISWGSIVSSLFAVALTDDDASSIMSLRSKPLQYKHFKVTFPQDRIVLITLDRQKQLNCIDKATSREIAEIWELFDQDDSLWVGIITGAGRAFCTGADLHGKVNSSIKISVSTSIFPMPPSLLVLVALPVVHRLAD